MCVGYEYATFGSAMQYARCELHKDPILAVRPDPSAVRGRVEVACHSDPSSAALLECTDPGKFSCGSTAPPRGHATPMRTLEKV